MRLNSFRKMFIAFVGLVAIAMLLLSLPSRQEAAAGTQEPANKVSAAGSTIEVFQDNDNVVTLMSELEGSITTNVTTVGNDSQFAEGTVKIWVEIDGLKVPVSTDDTNDPGKVVFCNRLYQRDTTLFDDANATIRTYMVTRNANGFNWMALNVGSATHLIEVKAELTTTTPSAKASAMAAVGKRTLIIEPVKSANRDRHSGQLSECSMKLC